MCAAVSQRKSPPSSLKPISPARVPAETRSMLLEHLQQGGELRTGTEDFAQRVGQTLQLIVATQEYLVA